MIAISVPRRANLMHSARRRIWIPSASRMSFTAADTLVLALDQARSLLDDGHLAAEAAVHLRKLEADVTAADDDEMTRQDIEISEDSLVR